MNQLTRETMIKAPIKRDTCKFQSITQSENTKTLQKKNRL